MMVLNENIRDVMNAIFDTGKACKFDKGQVVSYQGKKMDHIYYITKGIVRGYYLNEEGKEVTKCFSSEGELFGVEGFLYNREATYYIECLEAVDCIAISYDIVHDWMANDPLNASLVNQLVIEALRIMEERARALLLSDARQRYEAFQKDYGHIADRLKQKCVASYLGINEASLCRLKKKLT